MAGMRYVVCHQGLLLCQQQYTAPVSRIGGDIVLCLSQFLGVLFCKHCVCDKCILCLLKLSLCCTYQPHGHCVHTEMIVIQCVWYR